MRDVRPGRGEPGYLRTVSLVALGGLANFALLYYVQPLLPELADAFDVSAGASGLALSATTVAMIAGLLVAAPLAARIGRSTAVWASLVVTGAIGMLSVAAPGWETFLASRLAMGVGLAILPAAALAYVRDAVAPAAHLSANATYIAGTAVGGAIGRIALLPLAAAGGWQLPTVVVSALSIVVGLLLAALLPRDGPRRRTTSEAPPRGGLRLLGDPLLVVVCALGCVNSAIFVATYNAVAFRLSSPPFDLGAAESLVYLAYVACIVSPAAFGVVAARRGRAATTGLGLLLVAAATIVLVPSTAVTVFVGLAVTTFAYMGLHSILSGWAVHRGDDIGVDTSRASSAYLVAFYLGSTVAGTAATQLWAAAGWPGLTVLSACLLTVAGGLLAAASRRHA